MNFMDANITEENGKIYVNYNELKIELSKEMMVKIKDKGYVGKDVLLGVRSENVIINGNENSFSTKVDVTELLGSEIYVYYTIDDKQFIAKETKNMNFKMGDDIKVSFDKNKIHLFDKETGLNIIL